MTRKSIVFMLVVSVLSIASAACHRPAHAEAKMEAQERWSTVRGRVKFQLARQQFERGQFADVIKTLDEAIALDPSNAVAYGLLAKSNLELGKPASADAAVETAWKVGADTADLHYLKGVILEQRGQLPEALAEYEKARAMNASDVDCFIAQVECMVALGRPTEALTLIDNNAEAFDDRASVAMLGGRIAALLGDTDGAIRRYQHPSIVLAENSLVAQELGLLLGESGQCREAVRLLRPLVEDAADAAADDGSIRRGMATCYLALGEPALAQAVLLDYARNHVEDIPAQVLLAQGAAATGDFMTALRAIDLARVASRGNPEIELLLATIHWRRGDPSSAEPILVDLLTYDPYDVEAWCLFGEVLQAMGRTGEAHEAFDRALAIAPSSIWATAGIRQLGKATP